jgi:hypothetical protein
MSTKTEKYLFSSLVAFMGTFMAQGMLLNNVYTHEHVSLLLSVIILLQISLILFTVALSIKWVFDCFNREE